VARALVARPAVILADEPTAQLDSTHASQVTGLLLDAAVQLGAALVVSTHDLEVAARLPISWHMTDGRLAAQGGEPC
jgi:ABC-type lipoprotein export system ATPase subunit